MSLIIHETELYKSTNKMYKKTHLKFSKIEKQQLTVIDLTQALCFGHGFLNTPMIRNPVIGVFACLR